MISNMQKLRMSTVSTISLIVVFLAILIVQWALMHLGAYMSGFEGQIVFKFLSSTANAESWKRTQVMWIFLGPYLGLVVFYFIIRWQRNYPVKLPPWLQLIQSWSYFIILLFVFFMPLVDIIYKQGLYHALNWLHISRLLQFVFGIAMWLIFIYKAFHVSALFSTSLHLPSPKTNNDWCTNFSRDSKQILIQLPFLWYLPLVLLTIMIYILSGFILSVDYVYFLAGMLYILLINTWFIQRYNVIVK